MAQHFTLIIAGDNPEEMIKKYDSNKKVTPYKLYDITKASEYQESTIKMYEAIIASDNDAISEEARELYKRMIEIYKNEDAIDFYLDLTEGYDIDEETGDVFTDVNPDGHYNSCHLGRDLSLPLINKEGKKTFQETKGNVEWDKINLNNQYTYEVVWDMCMEGKKPQDEEEKRLFNNMKNRKAYFEAYGNRETYVLSNTAFWGYAFLSEKTGWVELEGDQFEWVKNFFNIFIEPLQDNTLISVYECVRND